MEDVLLPVTWELVEPEEGVSLVDGLIEQARWRGRNCSGMISVRV